MAEEIIATLDIGGSEAQGAFDELRKRDEATAGRPATKAQRMYDELGARGVRLPDFFRSKA